MPENTYIATQEQAETYAKYRPTYCDTNVVEEIIKYLNIDGKQVSSHMKMKQTL